MEKIPFALKFNLICPPTTCATKIEIGTVIIHKNESAYIIALAVSEYVGLYHVAFV